MSQEMTLQNRNKALVRASFERWSHGSGSPFELLLPDSAGIEQRHVCTDDTKRFQAAYAPQARRSRDSDFGGKISQRTAIVFLE